MKQRGKETNLNPGAFYHKQAGQRERESLGDVSLLSECGRRERERERESLEIVSLLSECGPRERERESLEIVSLLSECGQMDRENLLVLFHS